MIENGNTIVNKYKDMTEDKGGSDYVNVIGSSIIEYININIKSDDECCVYSVGQTSMSHPPIICQSNKQNIK